LLDVDLDYLFTTAFDHDRARAVLPDPWCSVESLAEALLARWPLRHMTTIATSLTGAFTPLRWKHLAQELAARLDAAPVPDAPAAVREFQEAERLFACGALADARAAFARAAAADPDYRHPFRTFGHLHRLAGRADDAARAFQAALALDPGDRWATLGLAMLAADAGRPAEALAWLGDVQDSDSRIDAWRTLCRARSASGDVQGAIAAGLRGLCLALDGAVPLSVWTSNRDRGMVDPEHFADHSRLSSLYRRAGAAAAALAHQRIAAVGGVCVEDPA
jgi:tetratricopeptide (TPR) repeat protein